MTKYTQYGDELIYHSVEERNLFINNTISKQIHV